jgi:hypothetical protein
VTVSAPDVVHDNVADSPLTIEVLDRVKVDVGLGSAFTVTLAVLVVDPSAFVATSVYVVSTVGDITWDPLAPTDAPFNATVVAFPVDQLNVVD